MTTASRFRVELPVPCATRSRDLRIDLLRGIALLVIFVDHQEALTGFSWLRPYTLVSLTYCDALEVFVFLSGLVSGLAYGPVFVTRGFVACQSKAFYRCLQLYFANALLFLTVFAMTVLTPFLAAGRALEVSRADYILRRPLDSLGFFLTGQYHPVALDLLHLYIIFLMIAPTMIAIASRNALLAVFASYGIYALAYMVPALDYYTYPDGFNPLSWQFLYCIGLLIGVCQPRWLKPILEQKAVLAMAALTLIAVVAINKTLAYLPPSAEAPDGGWIQVLSSFPIVSKPALHPIRLLNFACLAAVTVAICPSSKTLAISRFAVPLIRCGQNSLVIFCLGVSLNYLGAFVFVPAFEDQASLYVLIYDIVGSFALCVAALLLASRRPVRRPI